MVVSFFFSLSPWLYLFVIFAFQLIAYDVSRYIFLCVEFTELRGSVLMSFVNIGYFLAIISSNIYFVPYSHFSGTPVISILNDLILSYRSQMIFPHSFLCFQFGYFPFSSPDAFLLTHLMNSLFLAFHYVCVVTMFLLIVPISSCMLSTFSTRLFSILIRFILMNPTDNSTNIWVISSLVSIEQFLCYHGSHFLVFHMSCIFDCMLDILYLKKTD